MYVKQLTKVVSWCDVGRNLDVHPAYKMICLVLDSSQKSLKKGDWTQVAEGSKSEDVPQQVVRSFVPQ